MDFGATLGIFIASIVGLIVLSCLTCLLTHAYLEAFGPGREVRFRALRASKYVS